MYVYTMGSYLTPEDIESIARPVARSLATNPGGLAIALTLNVIFIGCAFAFISRIG